MKWKIDNVTIKNKLVLAPMSGVCDIAFRNIIKSMDCGLISTEMVSATAIMYGSKKSDEMLYMQDNERPISQQIFGPTPKTFKIASEYIEEKMNPDIIDINMGCPVTKVAIDAKSGSSLLKSPDKAYEIVKATVQSVNTPITVKIRSGWNEKSINAVKIAKLVEKAGASAITVHPRTRAQGYSGDADWSIIKEVKDNVGIPVIGNGDIRSCYDARKMLDETNCDAIMIGRGVLGYPWLIRDCINYLDYDIEPIEVTIEERLEMLKKHTNLLLENKDEKIAMLKMRTNASYYVKSLPGNGEIREKIFHMKTKDDLYNLIENYLKSL